MFRKGSQGRLTADLNKMRERDVWICGRGTCQASGTTSMKTSRSNMPGGAQEVAAGVPYHVGPVDHGKEFGFSKCSGKPLEDFFGEK